MIPLQGRTIGGYHFVEVLGEGGMGVVYRATQLSLDRQVAFKVLSFEVSEKPEALKRFKRETRIHHRLQHPGVVTVYDCGVLEGFPYLAMELVEGSSLSARIKVGGRFSLVQALTLAHSVADALFYLHGQGVVHRDLKPGNLLLSRDDVIKVTDFGLSRQERGTALTADSEMLGTLPYMPPEAFLGDRQGPPGDVYALGLILHEMLTGEMAVMADTPYDLAQKVMHEEIRPPGELGRGGVPGRLDDLIRAMLAKNSARRPDPLQVRQELAEIARMLPEGASKVLMPSVVASIALEAKDGIVPDADEDVAGPSPAPGAAGRSPAPAGARRAAVAIVAAAATLVLGLLGVIFVTSRSPAREAPSSAAPREVDGFEEAFQSELLIGKLRADLLDAMRALDRYDRSTAVATGARQVDGSLVFLREMGESQVGYSPFRAKLGDIPLLLQALTRLTSVVEAGDRAKIADPFWLDVDRMGWEILSEVVSSRGLSAVSLLRPEVDRLRPILAGGGADPWRRHLTASCLPFLEGKMDKIVVSLAPAIRVQREALEKMQQIREVWRRSPRGWLNRLNLRHRVEHLWRMEAAARGAGGREEPEKERIAWVGETIREVFENHRKKLVADPDVVIWTRWLTFHSLVDSFVDGEELVPEEYLKLRRILDEVLAELDVQPLPPLGAITACDGTRRLVEEASSLDLNEDVARIARWAGPCESHRKRAGEYVPLLLRNRRGHVP